jgi:hypothetical protein
MRRLDFRGIRGAGPETFFTPPQPAVDTQFVAGMMTEVGVCEARGRQGDAA